MAELHSSNMASPRSSWTDRVAAWLLPFHPVSAVFSVVLLSTRGKQVIQGIRTQHSDMYVWGLLGVLGWISVLIGVDLGRGALNWLVPFIFIWIYALGRWSVQEPEKFFRDLLRATGLLACVVVIARLLQLEVSLGGLVLLDHFGPGGRGYVIGQGANGLAVVLEVGAVGGLTLLLLGGQARERFEGAVIGMVSLAAVIVTLSRGAIVGIGGAALMGAVLVNWQYVVWVPAGLLFAAAISPTASNRLLSILDLSRNIQRLRIWEGSLKLLKDHLWFGVGPGNFGLVYPRYRLPEEYEQVRTPHNVYLYFASGWGLLGSLIFFGWIGWVMFRNLRRELEAYEKAIFLVLIAFWIHVLFDDLITAQVPLLLGILDRHQTSSHLTSASDSQT